MIVTWLTSANEDKIPETTKGKLDQTDLPDPLLRKVSKGKAVAPHKIHKITFPANTGYVVELMSDDFDALLRVEDSKGNILAFDDDGGQGLNSRSIFTSEDKGEYNVIVTALDGRSGNYILTIKAAPKKIIFARGGLLLNLTSSVPRFDPFLKLNDASGKQLGEDDDGGEGLNSRLAFEAPETATYQLVVTSYMQKSRGPYQLTIEEAN